MVYRIFGKSVALMALFGLLAIPLVAQEDAAEEKQDDEKLTFMSVRTEYDKQYSEFMKAYRAEKDPAEKRKLVSTMLPKKDDYAKKIFAIVEADPKSEDSLQALTWLQQGLRNPGLSKKVINLMLEHHIESEQIGSIAMGVARGMPSQEIEDTLARIIEKSPHMDVKGRTSYALMNYYNSLGRYTSDKSIIKRIEDSGNKQVADYLRSKTNMEVSAKIESLIEAIKGEYKEVTLSPRSKTTLAQKIEAVIFERENLQVGMTVPDIAAEDVDGVEFKLSDYRGKVVFLDFWGDW